jgi:uncharacterized phage-associated protein
MADIGGRADMSNPRRTFNKDKAVAVVLYLAMRTTRPSFMSIAKLMYFADITHLERYGRFISTDHYVAMQHGPVPSHTYALMRDSETYSDCGFRVIDEYFIEPIDPPGLGELSSTDVKCLDQIIDRFGDAPTWYLRNLSHDHAWHRAWKRAKKEGKGSTRITEKDLLDMLFVEEGNEGEEAWPLFVRERMGIA